MEVLTTTLSVGISPLSASHDILCESSIMEGDKQKAVDLEAMVTLDRHRRVEKKKKRDATLTTARQSRPLASPPLLSPTILPLSLGIGSFVATPMVALEVDM